MENILQIIQRRRDSFSKVEKKIADFLLAEPEKAVHMTVARLASQTGVSQGSIINFCTGLGFDGYSALKLKLAMGLSNREQMILSHASGHDTPGDVMAHLAGEIARSFQRTLSGVSSEAMAEAASLLLHRKRIEIYGVGSSAPLVEDAYYRFLQLGLPAFGVTDAHIASVSASFLDGDCAVIAVSHSGRTIETLQAVKIARQRGAGIISVTSYPDTPLTQLSDIVLAASTEESEQEREALISRYNHLLILDSLMMFISLKDVDSTLRRMENTIDIIGQHRL